MSSEKESHHVEYPSARIDRMMTAIVQIQDEKKACKAIQKLGITPIVLSTVGGLLARQNVILLIGLNRDFEADTIKALQENCRQRTEYVSIPLEGTPLPIPLSTPVTVGGATFFILDVERFEEF